jgi:uncharacterized membrane protein YkoI
MKSSKSLRQPSILGAALAFGVMLPMFASTAIGAALPHDPTHGSIRVGDDEPQNKLTKLAKVSQAQAEDTATRKMPGKVIETEPDEENGFLVWNVEVSAKDGTTSEVAVDAGNGKVLAIDPED